MNIHEFQAKDLLRRFDIPVGVGQVCQTVDHALDAAQKLAPCPWVIKAQIHAGGRGKAGGVVVAHTLKDVEDAANRLLGSVLVTPQTGPKGQMVHRLYIEAASSIAQEFYLSLVVDRTRHCVTIIASSAGGVNIEEVAAQTPDRIIKAHICPVSGYQSFYGRKIGFALGLAKNQLTQLDGILRNLYKAFLALDANQIEINPLGLTKDGQLLALDAKVSFDDNGLYRQPDVMALRDPTQEDPAETQAQKHDLNYVKLDGTIGCMVNGAGLAMATMDIIKLHGGEPANFLDVGGGASKERVSEAFRLIVADAGVRAILVNIFGGIMRCDIIAQGIVDAAREMDLRLPLVVRLQGTNREKGRQLLMDSGLRIQSVDDLTQAAKAAVDAARSTL